MRQIFLVPACLGLAFCALGQPSAAKGKLKDAEFVIEKERKHALSEAMRLFHSAPVLLHTTAPGAPLQYALPTIAPTFDLLLHKTRILRAQQDAVPKLYGNYLKGGYGNFYTPYVEGFFANNRHAQYAYGLRLKHLSVHAEESHNLIQLHGKRFTEHLRLGGSMHYDRDSYTLSTDDDAAATRQQILHQVAVRSTLANYLQGDFSYQCDASFFYLSDAFQAQESQWVLHGAGDYRLNDTFTLKAVIDLHLTKYSDAAEVYRNLWHMKPMLTFVLNDFDVQGGVNLAYQYDAVSTLNAYPVLEVQYTLHQWLRPYLGIGGDMQQTSLRSFLQENPLLAPNAALNHTNQRFVFYGGIRGDVVQQASFHTGIAVGKYQQLPCLTNSTTHSGRFDILYDAEATVWNVFGELMYANLAETFSTRLRGDYFHYTLQTLPKPWHKPAYQLDWLTTYRLYDKVAFQGTMAWVGGVEALNTATEASQKLDDVIDLGLGIDYRFSSRWSIFLTCQNLLARSNQRYQDNPMRGPHGVVGVAYAW